jgi:predicted Fe-Mo cluster-binding NifX family protein
MKRIAIATNNGETISRHLGEALFYLVVELDDAGGITFEKREKPHRDRAGEQGGEGPGKHAHLGPALFAPVHDCQILISGGMGRQAYDHAVAQGLEVILPAQERIDDALQAYRAGQLVSDMRRVHKH